MNNEIRYTVQVLIKGDYTWNDTHLKFNYDNMTDAMSLVQAFLVNLDPETEKPVTVSIVPELIKDEPDETEPAEEEVNDEREIDG